VAPVYEKGASSRKVYLPQGEWYDWWTYEKLSGGQTINRPVDLATMPLFVRAGTILPLDPVRQYTGQETDEPLTLRIYPGADGTYTLYEDDGISLDYLNGESTLTTFSWEDRQKILSIGPVSPELPDTCHTERVFMIELVPECKPRKVVYNGKFACIQL
jgi:alpha-glucosidase/alpha-D-xyloside xylohydrolase